MQFTHAQKTAAAWVAIAMGLVLLLWLLGPVLTPFVVAAVLAYALTPLVDKLSALGGKRLPRVLAVAVVEVVFILVVLSVALMIVPILAKEIPLLREQLPALAEKLNAWAAPLLAGLGIKFSLDVGSIKALVLKYINTNMEELFSSLLSSLRSGGSAALVIVGYLVLIPVALFYLLMDWKHLVSQAKALVPRHLLARFDRFTGESDDVLGQYLRGQLLVMAILAVYYSVGLALFGLDLALPIGVFTGLAMFVPYVGFGVGLILALLAGLLQFASAKALLMVALVYGSGQIIEGLFLTPRLVGERIGLHPLAVIFMLLAFGQLFGFVGVLIALPASAVLLVAARRLRASYVASDLYKG
jgi:predicted PurR-regulated permease PerM